MKPQIKIKWISDQKNNGNIKSHPLKGASNFSFIINKHKRKKTTMKFAIALVAALAQAADLQQYDGIDITIWDDGTFEVHDDDRDGIDITIWDDGTFTVHKLED